MAIGRQSWLEENSTGGMSLPDSLAELCKRDSAVSTVLKKDILNWIHKILHKV